MVRVAQSPISSGRNVESFSTLMAGMTLAAAPSPPNESGRVLSS